jgi:hypothetical protein
LAAAIFLSINFFWPVNLFIGRAPQDMKIVLEVPPWGKWWETQG